MNESKNIKDGALYIGIFVVLLLVTIFVPVLSMVSLFLLPVPFAVYASKHGLQPALMMVAVLIVLSLFFATVLTLPLVVLMGFGGIMIGTSIYKKVTAYETWTRSTYVFAIGLLFAFIFTQMILNVNWADQLNQMVTESMEMSANLLKDFGIGDQAKEAQEVIQTQMDKLQNLIPAIIASVAIFLAFISQWVSYKVLNRMDNKGLYFPLFRNLQFPVVIVWVYFVALIISFFIEDPLSTFYVAAENVLVLAGLLMTIQGFSFIFFFAHHKKVPKVIPILIVVATLIFPMLLLYLVRILGIIDIGFSLRVHMNKKK